MTTSAAVAVRLEQQPREAAPFVKWVGGKGRLLSQLRPLLPLGIEHMRHVEPFVGGGALFFARRPGRALLTDINPTLVAAYAEIRDDVEGVIAALRRLAGRHSKESYYQIRERYNQSRRVSNSKRAAMFIYLNKTCFNGLHRVNRKGEFNVPVGSYKNPRILNEEGLHAASRALRHARLKCAPFDALLEDAKPGDFIYFDPPYEPVSQTASFTSYARDGFYQEDQTRLRDVYKALDRRGSKLMLSNSDVPFIRDLYKDFNIVTVAAPRAINCDATKRGKVSEVIVRNY
ncbi:MAG: DNA adenine methylase [Deltaproteobacteria bacterium]|nr:MAG: DNA adenine methylase [Deltaproteobacteria bacterium]